MATEHATSAKPAIAFARTKSDLESIRFGGLNGKTRAFQVLPDFTTDDAHNFASIVNEYLTESMGDVVDSGGMSANQAWVNALLLQMVSAVYNVDWELRHATRSPSDK